MTPDPMIGARVIEVVEMRHRRGIGVESDPVRIVTSYYDRDGNLLAENDPVLVIGVSISASVSAVSNAEGLKA